MLKWREFNRAFSVGWECLRTLLWMLSILFFQQFVGHMGGLLGEVWGELEGTASESIKNH